jgi:hypothetical protein
MFRYSLRARARLRAGRAGNTPHGNSAERQDAMDEWNTTFVRRMMGALDRPEYRQRIQDMVCTWAAEHDERQCKVDRRERERQRIADEQGGDMEEWIAAGVDPNEDPPADLPLPPSGRRVTLPEKFAALAAIHDALKWGVEPLNPFPRWPSNDRAANRGMIHFEFLLIEAEKLVSAGDLGFVEPWLRDVEADLLLNAPPPAADGEAAKPGRRGRPKADYKTVQQEAALAAEWERARDADIYKPNFAKDKKMNVKQLDALLDRVAKRKHDSE